MARRIRSLKPDVWDDEALGECSTSARLLFVGLITQADDDGRLPGNPRWIASKVYPYDEDISSAAIETWLDELDRVDVIRLYEVAGKTYIWLPSWDSHQTIDKRYYRPSRLPEPPQESPPSAPRAPAEATDPAPNGAQESATPDRIGEEGIGGDRRGESEAAAPDATRSTSLSASDRESAPEIVALCELLADLIEGNGSKRPSVAQVKGWRKDARLMIEQDERTVEQVEAAMRWAHNHPGSSGGFTWRSVILSMGKLREKYDQLRLQANAERAGGQSTEHPADRKIRELKEQRDRLDAGDDAGREAA